MNDDTLIKKLKKKKIAPPCGLTWKEHDDEYGFELCYFSTFLYRAIHGSLASHHPF